MTPSQVLIHSVTVKRSFLLVIALFAASAAGCRQPDGPTPTLNEEDSNRVFDMSNDLRAAARGEQSGPEDFANDLGVVFGDNNPAGLAVTKGFAQRLATALVSIPLTDESAAQIARTSWMVAGATQYSDRQVKALQVELAAQLTALGVATERVDAVVAEVPVVQRAATTRPRRWYEIL